MPLLLGVEDGVAAGLDVVVGAGAAEGEVDAVDTPKSAGVAAGVEVAVVTGREEAALGLQRAVEVELVSRFLLATAS